jgi:serine/threonine-protein kinase TTK/MPS1
MLLCVRVVVVCGQVMGPGCKIFALKRIRLAGRDSEAASGFIDEINLLNSLRDKPNIIQLVDSQVCVCVLLQAWRRAQHGRRAGPVTAQPPLRRAPLRLHQVFAEEGLIYMVQEYGEIDLARLLAKHDAARREAAGQAGRAGRDALDENFIRLYWQQMLQVWRHTDARAGATRSSHCDLRVLRALAWLLSGP